MPALGRTLLVLSTGWVLLMAPAKGLSQDDSPDEYQVKLAFLYNFTRFVEWPAQAFPSQETPFNICVVGSDPFGRELENDLRSRKVGGHPIALTRLASSGDFSTCQIAFIRAEEWKHLAEIISRAKNRDVLTVGEMPRFLERGGQVNLVFDDKSLHFDVNLDVVRLTRLKFSSKLLALAKNLAVLQASPPALH